MYAAYSTILHTLRNSTESSPVWNWHPAILLFKLCRLVLPRAKHEWVKADYLTSILCGDWQSIVLRTLLALPFITLSSISRTQYFYRFTINISHQNALQHTNRLSAMCTIWSCYTCYRNTNLVSRTGNNTNALYFTDNSCICIPTILLFRNEVHIYIMARKSFLSPHLTPRTQNLRTVSCYIKQRVNGSIDIRGNTVKNIGSDLNQMVICTSLKDDGVSTHKPRSHVAFQTVRTAGICVELVLASVKDTKRPSAQPLAV
jgi:hypothetical protein